MHLHNVDECDSPIWVCIDCLDRFEMLDEGFWKGTDDTLKQVMEWDEVPLMPAWRDVLIDDEDNLVLAGDRFDGHKAFSKDMCGTCGSELAGSRFLFLADLKGWA